MKAFLKMAGRYEKLPSKDQNDIGSCFICMHQDIKYTANYKDKRLYLFKTITQMIL